VRVTLEVVEGRLLDRGRQYAIQRDEPDNITIGRSARTSDQIAWAQAHIQFAEDDVRLSRWHFMLQLRPPHCYVQDLGSTNHTYVNRFGPAEHLSSPTEVHDGDMIRAGATLLRLHLDPQVPPNDSKVDQEALIDADANYDDAPGVAGVDVGAFAWGIDAPRVAAGDAGVVAGGMARIGCCTCGTDVGDTARRDGRDAELAEVAQYLCQSCAAEERQESRRVGKYLILSRLGEGGMGVVHKAWHKETGRVVALKELLPNRLLDDHCMAVFRREISVTESLRHPNVVRFYETFVKHRRPYLVTEFLPGGNLQQALRGRERALSPAEACPIALNVLDGLAAAHEGGFVHRDIKPENVLFDARGIAKLSDMGLAKSFELAGQSGITGADESGGTVLYMAPEQFTDFRNVKPPADVYSMGVVLYYLLTARYPYDFPAPRDFARAFVGLAKPRHPCAIILEDEPLPIARTGISIPAPLARVIDRCLAKRQERRFSDAGELAAAIRETTAAC